MTIAIEVTDLHVHHGAVRAVDGVSFRLEPGTICGLLGRNGAGKTSLLTTMATYRRPTRGTVRFDGADPYEDAALVADVALVPAARKADDELSIEDVLELAGLLRPRWDAAYARRLLDRFGLPSTGAVSKLSTGMRSALSVTVGLAARTSVTLFDEPHLGMDAPARYAFYDELLADYVAHPRTIVVSTHLIDEVAPLVEDVVIIDHGRLVQHRPVDELRSLGVRLTGPATVVEQLTASLQVLSGRSLGRTSSVVVLDPLDDGIRAEAGLAGVDIEPIPLQDLFIHLTSQEVTS